MRYVHYMQRRPWSTCTCNMLQRGPCKFTVLKQLRKCTKVDCNNCCIFCIIERNRFDENPIGMNLTKDGKKYWHQQYIVFYICRSRLRSCLIMCWIPQHGFQSMKCQHQHNHSTVLIFPNQRSGKHRKPTCTT